MVEKTARRKRKKPATPESRGLTAKQVAAGSPPAAVEHLRETITADGGTVLGAYRDPLGGNWQILAALPLDRVEPTPYQRDLSEAHVARLAGAIDKLDRFLDPVIAVRAADGKYWTPNGYHRLGALRQLGARAIVALDAAVSQAVASLKARGFQSPYLKAFVVARIKPLRFKRGAKAEYDETIDRMLAAAQKFDPGKVRADQVTAAGGPAEE